MKYLNEHANLELIDKGSGDDQGKCTLRSSELYSLTNLQRPRTHCMQTSVSELLV